MTKLKYILCLIAMLLTGCSKCLPFMFRSTHSSDQVHILVAGQSNGNSPENGFGTLYSVTGKVHINHVSYGEKGFTTPSVDAQRGYDIAWMILGDEIATRTRQDVYITNVSYGNTNSQIWEQRYLPTLIDAIRSSQPDYIFWIQGESDAVDGLTPEDSTHAYSAIFTAISQSKNPSCRVITALDGYYVERASMEQAPARIAQRFVIQRGLAEKGPDIDIMRETDSAWFEHTSHSIGVGAEFAGQGFKEHADAWLRVMGI